MESLTSEARKLLKASLAQSTWSSYRNAVNGFIKFRMSFDLGSNWPAKLSDIVAYVAYLSIIGRAYSSISLHLSAIAFVHKLNNWPDPTTTFIITKLKEGCRRSNLSSDNRRPITSVLLSRLISILSAICKSSFETMLFRSVFLLAYFGFLRVSEYACVSKKSDTSRVLNLCDISFLGSNQVSILIRYSKTDQGGSSITIMLHENQFKDLCPVQALKDYLSIRPSVQGPLFVHFDTEPLTKAQVNKILKKGVETLGLPAEDYSSHSFRIGAATSAAIQGVSGDMIKLMGRWTSNAVNSYIRPERLISFL